MSITYKLFNTTDTGGKTHNYVIKNGSSFVPFDEANSDYQAYLLWVSEGNTAEAADQMKAKTIVLSSVLVFSGCIFLGVTNLQVTESNKNLSRDLDDFVRMFKMPVYNIN